MLGVHIITGSLPASQCYSNHGFNSRDGAAISNSKLDQWGQKPIKAIDHTDKDIQVIHGGQTRENHGKPHRSLPADRGPSTQNEASIRSAFAGQHPFHQLGNSKGHSLDLPVHKLHEPHCLLGF